MRKNISLRILMVLGVIGLSAFYAFPLKEKINLGLDLEGGIFLVLRVDTSKLAPEARRDAPERALEVVRNRIDQFGVKEPVIQRQGEDQIVVQLPGVTNRERALELIGKTALLEFKLVANDPQLVNEAINGKVASGYELKYMESRPLLLVSQSLLTGDSVASAFVGPDEYGRPEVKLKFTPEGGREFARITRENIGRQLAIVLDEKVHSAPVIEEEIPSGEARIRGKFTQEEALDLSIVLRVGALPAPIKVEEERTIGPLLGQDSIRAGVLASLIGTGLIFIFMAGYYLLAGLVSNIALLLNFLMILGCLGYLHSTLTLPGIAGIALTLGMAVDANVLINERIREEIKLGRPLRLAIENGYKKAFSAIFDSNLTTLVAAFFLFQFGTGPIRGFAVTLSLGLMASMFTAIVVTKLIFDILLNMRMLKGLPMLQLIPATNFDFIKAKGIWFTVSLVVIGLSLFSFFSKGNEALGVDFSGGQVQEYHFQSPIPPERVRSVLKDAGLGGIPVQQLKDNPQHFILHSPTDTVNLVQEEFKKGLPDNRAELLRIEMVGPVVGKELKKKAVLALVFALLGIMVYVAVRFKHLDFAVAGVVALFHDIIIAGGVLVFMGGKLDLLIITALLTIAGYSINDTIVIYDRVRELSRSMFKASFTKILNTAVNQTLSRTIWTSFATLLAVVSIYLFGGEVLHDFAFCLLVGFVCGVYSTVFIASALVSVWREASKSKFR